MFADTSGQANFGGSSIAPGPVPSVACAPQQQQQQQQQHSIREVSIPQAYPMTNIEYPGPHGKLE